MGAAEDARLAAIEARLHALEVRMTLAPATNGAASQGAPSSSGGSVASDADLDGQWGNPEVRKDPAFGWDGASYVGRTLSECPSKYLDALAKFFDWAATKDEEKGKTYKNKKGEMVPTAPLRRKDAALARGWSKRNAGKTFQEPLPAAQEDPAEAEIPF